MRITRIYRQHFPARRFIGKKYGDSDRVNGSFGAKWSEFFENGWFDALEAAAVSPIEEGYEDGGAYVGLMRVKDGEPFEYWIGMFLPPETPVPETPVPDGFESCEFAESELGIGWVYGPEWELYGHESDVAEKLGEEGMRIRNDDVGACWFFERYGCPRFTTPDEQGNVILDIGFFVES